MAFALLLSLWTARRNLNRRWTHMLSLAVGGVGFVSMSWWSPESSAWLNASFACVGVAWGSILSMPYAMLSGSVPASKMGIGMGVFNMFIVLPQIVAALGGIVWLNGLFFEGDVVQTMVLAGLSLFLAAASNLLIPSSAV